MRFLILTISVFFCATVFSQVEIWDLQDCMRFAVEHNYSVGKRHAQNSIYQQQYFEAIGELLPNIQGQTGANFSFGSNRDYVSQEMVSVNSFSNSFNVSGSLTLFDGLANVNRLKMSRVNKLKGQYELENEKDQVAYAVLEAFLNVSYYKSTVDLCQEQLAESTQTCEKMQRMEELGLKSITDVAEAKAKMAEDKYNLTRQNNILKIGIIILKEKMNFPIDEDLEIADSVSETTIEGTLRTASDIYNEAINRLPQALVARKMADASRYAYGSAKGAWSPRITMNGGLSSSFFRYMNGDKYDSWSKQMKDKKGEYVGLTLSVPLFTGFSRSASVKKSRAEMIITRSNTEETLRKIYSDIEQVVVDLNGQVEEYNQALQQVEAMNVAHKVNQRKYEEGLIDAIQVSTSANRLLKARVDLENSKCQYVLKSKLLAYYEGTPYIEIKK